MTKLVRPTENLQINTNLRSIKTENTNTYNLNQNFNTYEILQNSISNNINVSNKNLEIVHSSNSNASRESINTAFPSRDNSNIYQRTRKRSYNISQQKLIESIYINSHNCCFLQVTEGVHLHPNIIESTDFGVNISSKINCETKMNLNPESNLIDKQSDQHSQKYYKKFNHSKNKQNYNRRNISYSLTQRGKGNLCKSPVPLKITSVSKSHNQKVKKKGNSRIGIKLNTKSNLNDSNTNIFDQCSRLIVKDKDIFPSISSVESETNDTYIDNFKKYIIFDNEKDVINKGKKLAIKNHSLNSQIVNSEEHLLKNESTKKHNRTRSKTACKLKKIIEDQVCSINYTGDYSDRTVMSTIDMSKGSQTDIIFGKRPSLNRRVSLSPPMLKKSNKISTKNVPHNNLENKVTNIDSHFYDSLASNQNETALEYIERIAIPLTEAEYQLDSNLKDTNKKLAVKHDIASDSNKKVKNETMQSTDASQSKTQEIYSNIKNPTYLKNNRIKSKSLIYKMETTSHDIKENISTQTFVKNSDFSNTMNENIRSNSIVIKPDFHSNIENLPSNETKCIPDDTKYNKKSFDTICEKISSNINDQKEIVLKSSEKLVPNSQYLSLPLMTTSLDKNLYLSDDLNSFLNTESKNIDIKYNSKNQNPIDTNNCEHMDLCFYMKEESDDCSSFLSNDEQINETRFNKKTFVTPKSCIQSQALLSKKPKFVISSDDCYPIVDFYKNDLHNLNQEERNISRHSQRSDRSLITSADSNSSNDNCEIWRLDNYQPFNKSTTCSSPISISNVNNITSNLVRKIEPCMKSENILAIQEIITDYLVPPKSRNSFREGHSPRFQTSVPPSMRNKYLPCKLDTVRCQSQPNNLENRTKSRRIQIQKYSSNVSTDSSSESGNLSLKKKLINFNHGLIQYQKKQTSHDKNESDNLSNRIAKNKNKQETSPNLQEKDYKISDIENHTFTNDFQRLIMSVWNTTSPIEKQNKENSSYKKRTEYTMRGQNVH